MKNTVSKKILICIDAWESDGLKGRLYHHALGRETLFFDVNQLFSDLEELFDAIRYPAASTKRRIFGREEPERGRENEVKQPMNRNEEKMPDPPAGKKATFVVQVMYRQNATWQGKVVWSEKNETKNFRSALELIKLIDSAAEQSNL